MHDWKKLVCQAVGIALAVGLSGCGNTEAVLEAAEHAKTPSESLKIVREAMRNQGVCFLRRMGCTPDEWYDAESKYLALAAKAGDAKALREVFSGLRTELQAELRPTVLEKAKSSNDPQLLATAASIYGNGRLMVVDRAEQIAYLKRAYSAGDVISANSLARIYVDLKDTENAYYWSLLCVGQCVRDYSRIDLATLEAKLSGKDMLRIQAVAKEHALKN